MEPVKFINLISDDEEEETVIPINKENNNPSGVGLKSLLKRSNSVPQKRSNDAAVNNPKKVAKISSTGWLSTKVNPHPSNTISTKKDASKTRDQHPFKPTGIPKTPPLTRANESSDGHVPTTPPSRSLRTNPPSSPSNSEDLFSESSTPTPQSPIISGRICGLLPSKLTNLSFQKTIDLDSSNSLSSPEISDTLNKIAADSPNLTILKKPGPLSRGSLFNFSPVKPTNNIDALSPGTVMTGLAGRRAGCDVNSGLNADEIDQIEVDSPNVNKKHDVQLTNLSITVKTTKDGRCIFKVPTIKGVSYCTKNNGADNKTCSTSDNCQQKDDLFNKFAYKSAKGETVNDEQKEKEENDKGVSLYIAGVKVFFPLEPYSCQKSVMHAVISAANKEKNYLIESPTGSGKTLALLCGSMSFRKHYAEKYQEEMLKLTSLKNILNPENYEGKNDGEEMNEKNGMKKVPRIFYGTRTHKQITQVISEFAKTKFSHAKMTILGGRDNLCIQKVNRSKTELCNELLDPVNGRGCPYYKEGSKSYASSDCNVLPKPWDIEELIAVGEKQGNCPYYAARNILPESEIIFCPYNYLLDPDIRKNLQINVSNDIIILDEAHNIEDICRNIGSFSMSMDEFIKCITDCDDMDKVLSSPEYKTFEKNSKMPYHFSIVRKSTFEFKEFIKGLALQAKHDDYLYSKPWTCKEFEQYLRINGFSPLIIDGYILSLKAIIAYNDEIKEKLAQRRRNKVSFEPLLPVDAIKTMKNILYFLHLLTMHSEHHKIIVKDVPNRFHYNNSAHSNLVMRKKKNESHVRIIDIMCFNAGVIFQPLASEARAVILASGTLSPMASFSGELGVQFEDCHVQHFLKREQILITNLSVGPTGEKLLGTYEHVNKYKYQDELGSIVLDVCKTVPYGVLCFVPSYTFLQKLVDRWSDTGLMSKIEEHKKVLNEPRSNNHLELIMNQYRSIIQNCNPKNKDEVSGALLFAVYRGKISEGIDFSDNEARCVLSIGVPFPSKHDPNVDLKFKYNEENYKKPNFRILNGHEWYVHQAFRALNQSIGRCIRHRNDWGAVIMIDERLSATRGFHQYLPKWARNMWYPNTFQYKLPSILAEFVDKQKLNIEEIVDDNEKVK